MPPHELLRHLDHSLLRPTVTQSELERACEVARRLEVASVCLLPHFVGEARRRLEGSGVRTSTVVAFPHGSTDVRAKVLEAEVALDAGAEELDFVINVSAVLSGNFSVAETEIEAMTRLCHDRGAKVKVIFENCYLDDEAKARLCRLSSAAGADWVKTSTGFGTSGATEADVLLMQRAVGPGVGVKASGGIATLSQAEAFVRLGASRVGTSHTERIAAELGITVELGITAR